MQLLNGGRGAHSAMTVGRGQGSFTVSSPPFPFSGAVLPPSTKQEPGCYNIRALTTLIARIADLAATSRGAAASGATAPEFGTGGLAQVGNFHVEVERLACQRMIEVKLHRVGVDVCHKGRSRSA